MAPYPALLALACCGLALAAPPALRDLADARGVSLGTAVDVDALRNGGRYAETLAREFSSVTPENAMKFEVVHPEPLRYDFTAADALVDFAEAHHMQVHGHVLVWHEQLPSWLTGGDLSREALAAILRSHIQHVVGRYRGRIAVWDVAAEAVDEEGRPRETFWSRALGPDYLALAFRWAHEADPGARLLYNDYGGEGLGAKSDAIYRLARDLRARGVPIDGVGLQMHLSLGDRPAAAVVKANLARLAGAGLTAEITEMDVRLILPATPAAASAQAGVYREMLATCLAAPNCKGFAFWGFTDARSWIPEFFPGWGAALPFDEDYRPKPACGALMDALRRR